MKSLVKFLTVISVGASIVGCETVASVAQNVADAAKPSAKAASKDKPPESAPAPSVVNTGAPVPSVAASTPACERNFNTTGSFFSGKQLRTNSPLPGINADAAYKKVFAEIVKRGWQIISSDKEIRMISASDGIPGSKKTLPFNVVVGEEKGIGTDISFTVSLPGGVMASEDGIKAMFCDFTKNLGG
jgi:hypothetical protein